MPAGRTLTVHPIELPPGHPRYGGAVKTLQTIDEVGEFGLIARVQARLPLTDPQARDVLVPSGDDAAVLAIPDGRLVTSTDLHGELQVGVVHARQLRFA